MLKLEDPTSHDQPNTFSDTVTLTKGTGIALAITGDPGNGATNASLKISGAGSGDNAILIPDSARFRGGASNWFEFNSTSMDVAQNFSAAGTVTGSQGFISGLVAGASAFAVDLTGGGRIRLTSTDSTASPGDATINKPSGKSAIAAAATAAVITCSACTASSVVMITPLDIDTTVAKYKAVPTAGSFTVTVNAAATATWKFSWFIIN